MHRSLSVLFVFVLLLGLCAPAASAAVSTVAPAAPMANAVRLSQVYGGGGSSTGTYIYDYAELFNSGASAVTLTGWSLQYGSATGNFGNSAGQIYAFAAGTTIQPGRYLLVQLGSAGSGGSALPVTPDFITGNLSMGGASGKIALANVATALGCGGTTLCTLPDSRIVDSVSYGAANNGEGGTLVNGGTALTSTQGAVRKGAGCTDTDNNNADFDVVTAPVPRNSSTAANTCGMGDTAPTVSSTTPTDGATGVTLAGNVSITFSEPVTVTDPWFTISCTSSGSHTATVSGGPTTFTLNPDADFASGETCTVTVDKTKVADQDGTADPMAANYVFSFSTPATDPCTLSADFIHDIQGAGTTSPVVGATKTIQGIVVGDYETGGFKGYFVQEENPDADANAATSEGIFVFDNNATSEVNLGDKVRVTGTVAEYSASGYTLYETELNATGAPNVCATGQGSLVTPTTVSLPVTALTDLEPYEGMLVTFPQVLTVTDNYDLGIYGELTLSSDGKLWQFTHLNAPSVSGYASHLAAIALRSIVLDDGSSASDPDPIIYPGTGLTALNSVRVDDTIAGLTGVMDQRYGLNMIQPVGQVNFTAANPRTTTPPAVGGSVRVGSFNTLNFFVTIGTTACGPSGGMDCRGADNADEFTKQRSKLVAAMCALNADVLGLMELENLRAANDPEPSDGITDYVLKNLVGALNASPACVDDYSFIDNTGAGTDAIRQGLIYKSNVVTPVGTTAILQSTAFINGGDSTSRSRPSLTQAFQVNASGERFIVSYNHLKSKGSACDAADTGDGQANCATVRTNAAIALTSWLATNPTGISDPDILIMGDLNSYRLEAPITTIKSAGYTDLIDAYHGAAGYGYAFDGQMGYLDHALATASMTAQVTGAEEWHINSPEPDVLDYDTQYKSAGQMVTLYNADPYRSTDHDPVIVGLNLTTPDTTAPDTTIDSTPTNPTASTSASFTFSGTDTGGSGVASFECRLDGAAFAACATPQNYTGLANGSHTFQVRAIDNAGNTDGTPASFTWVVDATAPDTTILTNPPASTPNTSAGFTFSGSDAGTGVARLECSLDAAAFATCTSPQNYTGLALGNHTFQVRAVDAVGNTDATPASYTWEIVPPTAQLAPETTTPLFCVGENATINLMLSNITGLYGYQFQVNYDGGLVNAAGDFDNFWFDTTANAYVPSGYGAACAGGVCKFGAAKANPGLAVSGTGRLGTITLTGATAGTLTLTITEDVLSDIDGFRLTHTVASLPLTVCGKADLSGTITMQGRATPITTGDITLTDASNTFGPYTATFSATDGTWSITGAKVMPTGSSYTLKANHTEYLFNAKPMTLMPATAYPGLNTRLWGGDAINDETIEIGDLSCIGGAFGAMSNCAGAGSSDINGDGLTNIQDLSIAGGNFGKPSPQPW